jgi:(2R)-ethylmalonyl-CoA mutase
VRDALRALKDAAEGGKNLMPPSIACAKARVTTGEWADALRALFGEYRAPTGVVPRRGASASERSREVQERVKAVSARLGRPLKILIGKPGLDGHSNGAEQIAVKARDVGIEVVYEGIRLTPEEIASSARDEGVHVIGLSILSGSHGVLVIDVLERLRAAGCGDLPVVVGGIIPEEDARAAQWGVARVYTPKDFDLTRIMDDRRRGRGVARCRRRAVEASSDARRRGRRRALNLPTTSAPSRAEALAPLDAPRT